MIKGDVAALCRHYLTPGACAWDIGASDGVITDVMLEAVGPTGVVVAVEPDPRHVFTSHPRVTRLACAIGPAGQPPLQFATDPTQSSCYLPVKPTGAQGAGTVMALDDLPGTPQLVKVDAQGAELDVLDSGPRVLRHIRPVWIIECWPAGLTAAGTSALGLVERFWDAGYQVLWPTREVMTREAFDTFITAKNRVFVNLVAVP